MSSLVERLRKKESGARIAQSDCSNVGSSFLASHGQSNGRFLEKQGLDYVFVECEQRMWRVRMEGYGS